MSDIRPDEGDNIELDDDSEALEEFNRRSYLDSKVPTSPASYSGHGNQADHQISDGKV